MANSYDLVVLGTGTAARVAALRCRAAGWSVAVVDCCPYGGTCALRGCDPKKMLISGAEAIDTARRMKGRGVKGHLARIMRRVVSTRANSTEIADPRISLQKTRRNRRLRRSSAKSMACA